MSITTTKNGRLCNQIIRNLALSIIAKQNNLHVIYSNFDNIHNKLGIELFTGNDKYQVLKNNVFQSSQLPGEPTTSWSMEY